MIKDLETAIGYRFSNISLLQNALALPVNTTASFGHLEAALAVMAENGLPLNADQPMTRSEVAQVLYQAKQLSVIAPGMQVLLRQ